MKTLRFVLATGLFAASLLTPLFMVHIAHATSLSSETFTGISTPANAWISGGSGGSVACLTAATTSAANSIPACSGGPLDSIGSGVLQLTPNTGNQSGFAIYNTPISASEGLDISFDMFQYGGTGADGISFFLVDGAANPTQPGALGGSLGYSRNFDGSVPGIVGGYVGIGFDRWGNFSDGNFGSGGPGRVPNSITVRGSEATDYPYVTHVAASDALAGTTRANSMRHVRIFVSTNNVMSVQVDYGSGYVTELSGIDLNTINGAGSLPATFKFGFAASTGGSYNMHEIRGLSVTTNPPNVSISVSHSGSFEQGSTSGQFTLAVSNAPSAEPTNGTITVTDTLPAGLTPTAASGTGWSCNISGQTVTCTRPGDGANALAAGASTPNITIAVSVAANATTGSTNNTASVTTLNNAVTAPSDTDTVTILNGNSGDSDGVLNTIEGGAPNSGDANNDGTPDSQQSTVTSLLNPVTNTYAALDTAGCTSNQSVSAAAASASDGSYSYPAGLMDFSLTCTPGATATVTMYFYGLANNNLVLRKYNTVTQAYATVNGASFSAVTIGDQSAVKVTYQITDGGPLDQDGTANGTIVDPAGPAVLASATPSAPNTGLGQQPVALYYIAAGFGLSLLAYEIRKVFVAAKGKSPAARG